jgi:hypothetical protein
VEEIKREDGVISDAGPLIHLDELGCVGLLGDFNRVIVPATVWEEVLAHRPGIFNSTGINWDKYNEDDEYSVELQTVISLFSLHRGGRRQLPSRFASLGRSS